jgi:branched-chain amino acid transport system substrate-binding protein
VFAPAGIDSTLVAVPDTAGGPELASALTAAGAATADVVIPLVTVQGCIATYDALQTLGIEPVVVTTGLCFGTPMVDHLGGELPEGWYFGGYGFSYFQDGKDPGMDTYLEKVRQYAGDDVQFTGFAGPMFANIMTAAKFGNAVGADALTSETFEAEMRAFTGPMMLQVGPIECGWSPIFASVCAHQVGIQQYSGGEWVNIADGVTGAPVDVKPPA